MPVRQRSPTNIFNTPLTLPEDPMAFQTLRGRNPDGSTTVYHVHESMIHGGGGGSMYFGDNSGTNNSMMYGTQPAYGSPYAGGHSIITGSNQQYQQHPPQPYIVYAHRKNHDSEDESSDEEKETPAISPIVQSTSHGQRNFMKRCNRTSIPCVLLGIVMAISFVVGYVFMVESIVNRSRTTTSSTSAIHSQRQQQHQQLQDTSMERTSGNGSDNGNQQPLVEVAQLLNLEPQYFVVNKVLQPVSVAEVPPPRLSGEAGQPRSMSTTTTTHTGGADTVEVVEQQKRQQIRGEVVQPTNSIGFSKDSDSSNIGDVELESQQNMQILAQQSDSSMDNTAPLLSNMMRDSTTVNSEYPVREDGPL